MIIKHLSNIFFFVIMLLGNVLFAQEQLGVREKADALYAQHQYAYAAEIYLRLIESKSARFSDLENLANCYYKMNDYEAAETWYSRVIENPNSPPRNLLIYGRILKNNSRYPEAKQVLQEYSRKVRTDRSVKNEIEGCDSAIIWLSNPTKHQLKNESAVNTPNSEFGAFPVKDNVYYAAEPKAEAGLKNTYGRTGKSYLKIHQAKRNADLTLFDALLNNELIYNKAPFHTGPLATNNAGNVFYVTRTQTGKKKNRAKMYEEGEQYKTSTLELYVYTKTNEGWDVQPFQYNNPSQYSVGHATLSPDEKTLYFVSDMRGSLGGTDIWYCELQANGSWSVPKNAGKAINTTENEMFPFVASDGTLYYSSNGLPGMGGLDIFKAKGERSSWTKIQNMGYPLNSANDDFAFVIDTDNYSGYLSSNRKGGAGNDDIYSFRHTRPKLILALEGVVYNKKTLQELPLATISLLANGELAARKESITDGSFYFDLSEDTDYTVLAQKPAFYADSVSFTTKGLLVSDTLKAILNLDPLFEIGKTLRLQNIHYNFDKYDIRPDAAKILDELVRTLRDNPTLKIELASHTDSRGSDSYNLDLSQRRAQSVVDYLVRRGISRARLTAKGYGESKLLNHCINGAKCSADEHQQNRRTEFTILEF